MNYAPDDGNLAALEEYLQKEDKTVVHEERAEDWAWKTFVSRLENTDWFWEALGEDNDNLKISDLQQLILEAAQEEPHTTESLGILIAQAVRKYLTPDEDDYEEDPYDDH